MQTKTSGMFIYFLDLHAWQERRDSNPQPPVLETGALPIELHSYHVCARKSRDLLNLAHATSPIFKDLTAKKQGVMEL